MPSNSSLLADLDELIDLCATGEGESTRVIDLAERLRSSNRVAASIEGEIRRDLVRAGRQHGYCEICGGDM